MVSFRGWPNRNSPPAAAEANGELFGPEMQLLLQVARRHLAPSHRARIGALLEEGIDWQRLMATAMRHKMLPLLAVHLRAWQERLPAVFQERLVRYNLNNARTVLQFVSELVELFRRFERTGIEALPYKGPVLGAQLYGSPVLRQVSDLDVVIRPADLQRAREVLSSLGYYRRYALAPDEEAFMVRNRYSENYDHEFCAPVELHWAFTNGDIALPLALEDLLPNVREVPVGGIPLPAFGSEDLLILLCVHGAKHRWDRLEWLCGVAEAVRAAPPLNWDRLVERSSQLGVRRMVLLGLLLTHDLLDAPVPSRVVDLARKDRCVVHAASLVPGFLVEDAAVAEADSLPTDLFRYQLRERWRDRLRFVYYRVTTPSQPENWSAVSLGSQVVPLHAFMRPFRLIFRLLSRTRGRLRSTN